MSQFFWQTALQNPAPQNEPHQNRVQNQSAVPSQNLTAPTMTTMSNQDDIGWSSIGLANNAPQQTNHSMQQPQQHNQQHFYTTTNNPSITASEYSSLASDPYGAAVLQGYSASSASGYQFSYQTPLNSQTEQLNYVVSGGYENAQNNNNKNNFYGISEEDSNTLYHNQLGGVTNYMEGGNNYYQQQQQQQPNASSGGNSGDNYTGTMMMANNNTTGLSKSSCRMDQQQYQMPTQNASAQQANQNVSLLSQSSKTKAATHHHQQQQHTFGIHQPILTQQTNSINEEKNIASEKQDSTRSSSTSSKGWSVERDHSTVSTPQATETASATTVNSLSAHSGTYDGLNSYNNDGAMVTGTTPNETAHQNGGMTGGTAAVHTPEQTQRVDEQRYHSEPPMSMVQSNAHVPQQQQQVSLSIADNINLLPQPQQQQQERLDEKRGSSMGSSNVMTSNMTPNITYAIAVTNHKNEEVLSQANVAGDTHENDSERSMMDQQAKGQSSDICERQIANKQQLTPTYESNSGDSGLVTAHQGVIEAEKQTEQGLRTQRGEQNGEKPADDIPVSREMVAPNNTAQPPQATETENVVHTPVVAVAQVTPIVATQQQHSNSNATTNPIVPMVSEATVLAAVPSQGVVPSSSGPVAPTTVPTASLQQQKPQQQQLCGGFGAQLTNPSTVATSSQQQQQQQSVSVPQLMASNVARVGPLSSSTNSQLIASNEVVQQQLPIPQPQSQLQPQQQQVTTTNEAINEVSGGGARMLVNTVMTVPEQTNQQQPVASAPPMTMAPTNATLMVNAVAGAPSSASERSGNQPSILTRSEQLNETETNSVSRAAEPVSVTSNAIATQQQQQQQREEEPNRMAVVVKQEVVEEAEQEDQGTGKISVQPLGAANTLAVSRNTDDAAAGNPAKRHQANEPTIAVTTTTPRIPSKQLETQTAGAAAVFDNSSPLAPLSSSSSMVNDELATEREHHQEQQQQQQQQQQKVVPSKKENKMKSVRERYKLAKEQYSDVMKRLDKHRTEVLGGEGKRRIEKLLEWKTPPKNVLLVRSGSVTNNVTGNQANNKTNTSIGASSQKSSTPKESASSVAVFKHPDISAIDEFLLPPVSRLTHSFTVPDSMDSDGRHAANNAEAEDLYGDEFVRNHRRARYARMAARDCAPSRGAKSDIADFVATGVGGPTSYMGGGAAGGGTGGVPRSYMKDSFYAYDNSSIGGVPGAYSSSSYALNYYPSGRHSLGPVHAGGNGTGRYPLAPSKDQYAAYAAAAAAAAAAGGLDQSSIRRRPQSSFDARSHSRYERSAGYYGNMYDAYYNQQAPQAYAESKDGREREYSRDRDQGQEEDDDDESSANDEEEGSWESDDEMAQIHYQQQMMRMRMGGLETDPEERYYLGVIQLSQNRALQLLYKYPPPQEYFHLPPIERVAYLFYCALYKHHFQPVSLFHKRFNREYYNYTCDGDSTEMALWKICRHTQDEFIAKRSLSQANQLKAYEMSQKQLFSDDRETPDSSQKRKSSLNDGVADSATAHMPMPFANLFRTKSEPLMSDRGSRCEHEEEDSDRLSVESALREPLKFRCPHAFVRFGVGGKVLIMDPSLSTSLIEVKDLKVAVKDSETKHIVEAVESFKGPLIAGVTPIHSVRLYVQRQIERILKSDAYRSNASNGYANDALLIWQLLEMIVQQQGRVTGPDLSRLLMAGCHSFGRRAHAVAGRDKASSNTPSVCSASPQPDERNVDPRAFERFTQFLLGGHIDEAIDSALKDGLYADALVLARRVCANDPRKLDRVETAFLTHRSEQNPVMTLLSVASDTPAPILTNPPSDDSSSWRSHAAVVLANLNSATAFNTVYHLGRVLARRQYHAAADFCFLAVSLLAGYDPFQPIIASDDEEDASIRQHISLIHASIPGDDSETKPNRRYSFSISDLHATEIFEYATRLSNSMMPTALSASLEYQLCRLEYAELISEFGGFTTDAFRYCLEVARGVWDRCSLVSKENLIKLCDLADRLQFVSGADPSETAWIPAMRSVIDQRIVDEQPPRSVGNADQRTDYQQQQQYVSSEQQATITEQQKQEQQQQQQKQQHQQMYGMNTMNEMRQRNPSISSEAVDWHAEHQEPLLMAHVEESIPSDMSSKSTTNQISNEAKPRMSPAGGAVARVGGGEHHQHHILHQRRTSTNTTPASTAGQSQMAFPPSMPPTGNVPSSHHQTASMRDQQQSANAPYQNTATSAQAHANAMSNMMPSNEAMGQPPQLYTAETGRDSSYMATKGGGGQQQTHAMFWQGEEANIRTASRDGREEDSSESHFTVVPSDTTSASSVMTNQQLNMMGGGHDGTQMGMTANSRSQDQVEEDQMTDAGFTGITTTMTATRTSNSSTSVNESTYRKHSGTNDASGTPTATAGMVSPYSQMNDSVFTPTGSSPEMFGTPPENATSFGGGGDGAMNQITPQIPEVVSKQPQTAPSAARMPPQPPSSNAPQMPQMGQAQASSSSENDVRSGQMNSSAAANAGAANGANQQHHQSSGGGIFSILKAKIVKAIPTGHEMILPDDKNPSIVWDPVLNKYVGAGVEEEPINTPPPSTANSGLFESMSTHGSSGGLRAARVSGGSRYFNPLNDASSSSAQTLSQSPVPVMQMPVPTTSFGFIPSMPDNDDSAEPESPFSVSSLPTDQQTAGTDTTAAAAATTG